MKNELLQEVAQEHIDANGDVLLTDGHIVGEYAGILHEANRINKLMEGRFTSTLALLEESKEGWGDSYANVSGVLSSVLKYSGDYKYFKTGIVPNGTIFSDASFHISRQQHTAEGGVFVTQDKRLHITSHNRVLGKGIVTLTLITHPIKSLLGDTSEA